jgi:hypothetical protein
MRLCAIAATTPVPSQASIDRKSSMKMHRMASERYGTATELRICASTAAPSAVTAALPSR